MEVRRLGAGDEDELRTVRLAALRSDPDVFGSTLAREEGLGPADWTRRLGPPGVTFVVGDPAAAMAWGLPDRAGGPGVGLFGMWVAPDRRGTGAADALVAAVIGWATDLGATQVDLTVLEGNEPAEALYRRHGFVRTGAVETRPRDGLTEARMSRPVAPPTSQRRSAGTTPPVDASPGAQSKSVGRRRGRG